MPEQNERRLFFFFYFLLKLNIYLLVDAPNREKLDTTCRTFIKIHGWPSKHKLFIFCQLNDYTVRTWQSTRLFYDYIFQPNLLLPPFNQSVILHQTMSLWKKIINKSISQVSPVAVRLNWSFCLYYHID